MKLNVLTIGDIVGPGAVAAMEKNLWEIRKEYQADFVVVNGENAAVGNGLDVQSAKALLSAGADVITTGNHVWQKKDLRDFLASSEQIIRPANYPPACPGSGYTFFDVQGYRFLVINVMGTIYLEALENPFFTVDRILAREAGNYDFAVMDIHAEATSEKIAMGLEYDGKIQIIFGTHTHVQTADLEILPGGTGYITDLGMTGPIHSVLGIRREIIVEKLRTKMPVRFEVSENPICMCGAFFVLDTDTGGICKTELVRKVIS